MKATKRVIASDSPIVKAIAPLTKMKRFWCKNAPFMAYQVIETEEIVMSARQLTIKNVKSVDKVADEFIKANNLPTREVTLPNRSKVTAYPLSTVVAYWSYLNASSLLPEAEKKVLGALISGEEIKEEGEYLKENASRVTPKAINSMDHPVPLARVAKVKILPEAPELTIFIMSDNPNHPYWIEETEGLGYIRASTTALCEQTGGARRQEFLKKKKCTFITKSCFQERDGQVFKVNVRPLYDWIRIWEYFGSQKNGRALSVLAELAMGNLESRLSQLSQNAAQGEKVKSITGTKKAA
jgi:hypothetical protein